MESYKNLKVYKEATKSMKRAIEDYQKQYHPTNDQLYLQLRLYELSHLSKKEQRKPSGLAAIIILGTIILIYVGIIFSKNPIISIALSAIMIVLAAGFYLGLFSEAKMEKKKIRKQLAQLGELPDFTGNDK